MAYADAESLLRVVERLYLQHATLGGEKDVREGGFGGDGQVV